MASTVATSLVLLLFDNGVVVTIWYHAPELLLGAKHYTSSSLSLSVLHLCNKDRILREIYLCWKDKETRPMKKSKGKDKGKGVLIHEEEEEEFQDASSDDLDELDGLPIRFEDDSLDDEASDEDDIMDEDDY
ncbi:Cyclin-dependent kinase E-1 -like protein [Tripterygium wilfordii]|uniref:Cyclin-dependent kinase E-1 -like protein n=1 Tax=Tripterygium wilfordii TaxID=458696 RepID=A0A7J7CK35_TRIWF|nr:Cyclin-dependent kinase E-1 -like protein [Tripterygium wilfordii]